MGSLEDFVSDLYIYLTGKANKGTSIVRVHTRKLQETGELSFPLKTSNWCSLIGKTSSQEGTIFRFLDENESDDAEMLICSSKSWILNIDRTKIIKDNVHIYLNRTLTFRSVIESVLDKRETYGADMSACKDFKFNVRCDNFNSEQDFSLSELRANLLMRTVKNLINFCGGIIVEKESGDFDIHVTLKSSNAHKKCLCGAVLNVQGVKDVTTIASNFYEQRTLDMRMMAEHKYGLRITSQSGWSEFFQKLGSAAVIIELLRNRPNQTVTTDVNNEFLASRKGAAFILYNCARLATLFKEFNKRISKGVYQKLPEHPDIDFNQLTQPEEWELLYIHILQFPCVIKNCIRDIAEGRIYPNCLISALSSMSLCFSVYYRRVKILVEPREHIFPTMHARIYLLKALEQVMHNGLRLLDIQPVKQM